MRKGQFTAFVILGIVLVAVFAFMLFARNVLISVKISTQQKEQYASMLQTSPIQYRVQSCLDAVTQEGVYWLGLQGGVLYDFQNGSTPFYSTAGGVQWLPFNASNYSVANVSYGLRQQNNPFCVNASTPGYPYPATIVTGGLNPASVLGQYQLRLSAGCIDGSSVFIARSGPFGNTSLSYACSQTGPNKQHVTNLSPYTCGEEYGVPNVQDDLAQYVKQHLVGCVNFSNMTAGFEHNITITDEPNITVTYGSGEFTIKAGYPFTVLLYGREPIVHFVQFERRFDIRLKEILFLTRDVLSRDAKFISSNLSAIPPSMFLPYGTGFTVRLLTNPCMSCTGPDRLDDVLQITDNASFVHGKPFLFQVAVQNRWPALDYMHTHVCAGFDYCITQNGTIMLTPEGYDPDTTTLNYSYEGWKETQDAYFDEICCVANVTRCRDYPASCVVLVNAQPLNWTTSIPYNLTRRNASYTTNASDAGLHFVTIRTTKLEGGYADWQNISILVYDYPVAVISGRHNFMGISNVRASIEDPYELSANGSRASFFHGGNISSFIWNDSTEGWVINGSSYYQPIPNETTYSILNIRPLKFSTTGNHTISLIIQDTSGPPSPAAYLTVNVTQCLPYRANTLPYPYDAPFSGGDFLLNHTCCRDDPGYYGTYAGTSRICFTNSSLSCRPTSGTAYFPGTITVRSNGAGLIAQVNTNANVSGGDVNDVFVRDFHQYCSNDRGNACSGAATDTWTVRLPPCDNTGGPQSMCVGPCSSCNKSSCGTSILSVACYNYTPGQTFEKNFNLTTTSTLCDNTPKCSVGSSLPSGAGSYGNGSDPSVMYNYSCKATCDGKGMCTAAYDCQDCRLLSSRSCVDNRTYELVKRYCGATLPAGNCTGTMYGGQYCAGNEYCSYVEEYPGDHCADPCNSTVHLFVDPAAHISCYRRDYPSQGIPSCTFLAGEPCATVAGVTYVCLSEQQDLFTLVWMIKCCDPNPPYDCI